MQKRLFTAVSTNDKVFFHWCMLTAEIEEVHAETVLDMLVSMWITIRGFSFASIFIEMYKLDKRKGLQRSKVLRKDTHRFLSMWPTLCLFLFALLYFLYIRIVIKILSKINNSNKLIIKMSK